MDCVFCSIVSKEINCKKVAESEGALAFLDHAPKAAGHSLVIPKSHAVDIFDIDEEAISEVFRLVKKVAQKQLTKLNAEGITLLQSNGRAAGQEVFHYHVHVIPRWYEDELRLPWSPTSAVFGDVEKVMNLMVQ